MNKVIHLDLNGMPPTLEQLLQLIPIFAHAGYDTLMLGWEDKFPWLEEQFRAKNAFSADEIIVIQKKIAECGMSFIPIIQILGHLENFLSPDKYAHLREVAERTDCLNPLHPAASKFALGLIEEMLTLSPNIKYMHIGGDEVWTLGTHCDTKLFIEKHNKAQLYIKHIAPIIELLKTRGIRPLLWHDMLINWQDQDLLAIKDDVDIVFWGYEGTIPATKHHYNEKYIQRFSTLGFNLWGAGAYKGASGCDSIVPNLHELMLNANSWYEMAEKFNFTSLIATGWSRYSQFHPPCDPIYASFASLFIIGAIFAGEHDINGALDAMHSTLEKYNLKESCNILTKTGADFSTSCDRAWRCIRNLHQQYALEELFVPHGISHLAKVMFDDFETEMKIVNSSADILRQALQPFISEQDITQLIDTKVTALERLRSVNAAN